MKFVDRTLFELLRYNKVWTDGRTDRRTDRQTDKVITIGLPHLRWRGPKKHLEAPRFPLVETWVLSVIVGISRC